MKQKEYIKYAPVEPEVLAYKKIQKMVLSKKYLAMDEDESPQVLLINF
jgi:hypothetical protein